MDKIFIAVIIVFILIAAAAVVYLVKALFASMDRYKAAAETIDNLEGLNMKLRSQRHDYINQLQVVYGLLEIGEYEEAHSYLKPIFNDMMKVGKALKTRIPAVNALLMAKMQTAEARGIDMYVEVKSDLKNIGVEGWELCKVMSNIIDNAMTAVEAGEREEGHKKVYIEINETPDTYIIRITNNGPVITEEEKRNIFKSGYTTKKEPGHGEGLAIVTGILKEHGARMRVDSSKQETVFEAEFFKQPERKGLWER